MTTDDLSVQSSPYLLDRSNASSQPTKMFYVTRLISNLHVAIELIKRSNPHYTEPRNHVVFPFPSKFGYSHSHPSREAALKCARDSREAFRPLLGDLFLWCIVWDHMCSKDTRRPIQDHKGVDAADINSLLSMAWSARQPPLMGVVLDPTQCQYQHQLQYLIDVKARVQCY